MDFDLGCFCTCTLYMYIVHFLVQEQITVNKVIQKTHDNLIMTSPRQREFDFINCCSNLLVNLRTENVRAENCWVRADTVLDHNRLFEISKISIAYRLRLLRDSKLWLRNYQLVNFKPGLKVHFRFCVTVFKYSVDKIINYWLSSSFEKMFDCTINLNFDGLFRFLCLRIQIF